MIFLNLKRGISRLKTPFLKKEAQGSSTCNLTSQYSSYRGGLYSLEEGQIEHPCDELNQEHKEIDSNDVEVVARIAFVVAFLSFNFFYWIALVYFVWRETQIQTNRQTVYFNTELLASIT